MTLPLLKSRQTTQQSIHRSKASDRWRVLLATVVIAICSGVTLADEAAKAPAGSKSPLERLRLRSAFERWDALKLRLKPRAKRAAKTADAESALLPVPEIRPAVKPVITVKPVDDVKPVAVRTPATEVRPVVSETPVVDGIALVPVIVAQETAPEDAPFKRQPMADGDDPLIHAEKGVNTILPYFDYEPERVAGQEQDCETICPCADGSDCKKPGGTKPCPCPEDDIKQPWIVKTYTPRAFDQQCFNWNASDVYSRPLYFEDMTLERYGHAYCCGLQPLVSVGRFTGQLALLPYQMAFKPSCQKRYPLGHYRPGEWAPKLLYQIPLNAKATAVQAGVVAGSMLIFP